MKIALKELRETFVCLKIIAEMGHAQGHDLLEKLSIENNELISIFRKSITTAEKNMRNE
jgi:hypothetical protein